MFRFYFEIKFWIEQNDSYNLIKWIYNIYKINLKKNGGPALGSTTKEYPTGVYKSVQGIKSPCILFVSILVERALT